QILLPGLALDRALEQAQALDGELGRGLLFAYHKEFGFLASCPTNVGTGLRASCLVHLPALVYTQNIGAVLQELARVGLVARGFYGEGSKVYGDLFQISNATSVGKTEQEFAEAMTAILKNVRGHEIQMRERLVKGAAKTKTLDRLWRAYAALSYCRLISFEEAMQELSWIRLGFSLGVKFDHLALAKVNELIVLAQPAHIQMHAGRELGPRERDSVRAALISRTIKGKGQ
ncbi:MAG: ATP--guanido phosphotransferase, partial [Elusimicrobiota bacterium]